METLIYIGIFALGVLFDRILVWKFSKPTTENNYNATVKNKGKNKVRGKDNTQDVTETFEINNGMSNKEIREIVRECKRSRN